MKSGWHNLLKMDPWPNILRESYLSLVVVALVLAAKPWLVCVARGHV